MEWNVIISGLHTGWAVIRIAVVEKPMSFFSSSFLFVFRYLEFSLVLLLGGMPRPDRAQGSWVAGKARAARGVLVTTEADQSA